MKDIIILSNKLSDILHFTRLNKHSSLSFHKLTQSIYKHLTICRIQYKQICLLIQMNGFPIGILDGCGCVNTNYIMRI